MKVRHLVGLVALVGAIGFGAAVPVAAETNLVTNGDFETPVAPSPANILSVSGSQLTGWTILPGGVMDVTNKDFADNGSTTFPVYSGNQALDLNSLDPASMTQDLTTVPGSTYHVFFALTGVPPVPQNECPSSFLDKSLTVSAGSSSHDFTFHPNPAADPPNNQSYVTEEFDFVATDATTTLEFASTTAGCAGPVIDAVSVTLVVPPETPLAPAAPIAAAPAFTG
jgi:hypothetical protein